MILRKRLKLNGQMCEAGTPITDEMKAAFGRHRLKIWWEAGIIERSDFEAPVSAAARAAREASGPMRHVGNGWYEVDTSEGTQKVRGKKSAEELLAAQAITSDPETPETEEESPTSERSDIVDETEEPESEETDPEGEQDED